MIELFARRPVNLDLPEDALYTRIPVDQDIISLSAILLDDAYFGALQATKRELDGVTIVDETLLIPFKARAVLDLTARSEQGANVDRKDIRKHRNDVFRLAQLLPQDARVTLPEPVRRDLRAFVDLAHADQTLDPRAFNVPFNPGRGSRSSSRGIRAHIDGTEGVRKWVFPSPISATAMSKTRLICRSSSLVRALSLRPNSLFRRSSENLPPQMRSIPYRMPVSAPDAVVHCSPQ